MEFEFYNVDGSYISNVVINSLEELVQLSIIYNKRPIEVDIKGKKLRLKEEGENTMRNIDNKEIAKKLFVETVELMRVNNMTSVLNISLMEVYGIKDVFDNNIDICYKLFDGAEDNFDNNEFGCFFFEIADKASWRCEKCAEELFEEFFAAVAEGNHEKLDELMTPDPKEKK